MVEQVRHDLPSYFWGPMEIQWSPYEPVCGAEHPFDPSIKCRLPIANPGPALHLLAGGHVGINKEGMHLGWPRV